MQELMSRNKAYALSPRDCLKTTLFQKWQRIIAPPGTRGTSFTLHYRIIHFCSTCCVRVTRVVAISVVSLFTVWQVILGVGEWFDRSGYNWVMKSAERERRNRSKSIIIYVLQKWKQSWQSVLPKYARVVSTVVEVNRLMQEVCTCINLEPWWGYGQNTNWVILIIWSSRIAEAGEQKTKTERFEFGRGSQQRSAGTKQKTVSWAKFFLSVAGNYCLYRVIVKPYTLSHF